MVLRPPEKKHADLILCPKQQRWLIEAADTLRIAGGFLRGLLCLTKRLCWTLTFLRCGLLSFFASACLCCSSFTQLHVPCFSVSFYSAFSFCPFCPFFSFFSFDFAFFPSFLLPLSKKLIWQFDVPVVWSYTPLVVCFLVAGCRKTVLVYKHSPRGSRCLVLSLPGSTRLSLFRFSFADRLVSFVSFFYYRQFHLL